MSPNLLLQVAVAVSFCVVGFAYLYSMCVISNAVIEFIEKHVAPRIKALFSRRSS